MEENKAKIYYIFHSGFVIETMNYLLIFDYFKEPNTGNGSLLLTSLISSQNIRGKKEVIVFCSHSHGDHFNPEIFGWESFNPKIKYILSNDIKIPVNKSNYILIKEDDETRINSLYVRAFGSTDIGVSFLVTVDNLRIFHAGDLNWWHWKEDSTAEQQSAESDFKHHIEKIKKELPVDIAFFPVDPRLDEFYYLGGQYFGEQIQPKLLIPMHFGSNNYITEEFSNKMKKLNIKTVEIYNSPQEINFDL